MRAPPLLLSLLGGASTDLTHCARRTRAEFEKAIQLFIQHSDREEDEILKDLSSKLSPEDNDRLAKEFLAVR